MSLLHDQAELLVAIWRLGAGDRPMPGTEGVLDRALEACAARLPFPLGGMSFSTTSVGRRCLELPQVLLVAQQMMLIDAIAPAYRDYVVRMGEEDARVIVVAQGMSSEDGRLAGAELVERVRMETRRA